MTQTGVHVQLSGEDGNIFYILGRCTKAMRRAGFADAAEEMAEKVLAAESYDESLQIIMQYCEVA